MKRTTLNLIISAIVGFGLSIGVILLFTNDQVREFVVEGTFINDYYLYILIGVIALGLILLIISFVMGSNILKRNKQTGEETDALDDWTQRAFYNAQTIGYLGYLLSMLALALTTTMIMSDVEIDSYIVWSVIGASIMLVIIATINTVYLTGLLNKVYPERELPNINDKDYAKKLLEVSDEGERHMILNGLYETNQTTQLSLLMGVVFLIIIGVATETNQLLGIIVLLTILAVNHLKYSGSIKKQL